MRKTEYRERVEGFFSAIFIYVISPNGLTCKIKVSRLKGRDLGVS
jgi:hypothetical protein